ncbi:MAG: hypothetical protein KDE46_29350, partial [Caldilineaceae bacterium]|nr:hypothetical protein [Caldilineaceae bacterium]
KTTTKTTTRKRRTPTLRADLKKYAGESYSTDELVGGVTTILNREGTDILRDALMAYLAHKVPVMGEMINDSLVDDLIGKLTDDYGKVKAAERKGIRAVINWLDGEFDPGSELQSSLVHMLVQAESPASDTSEFSVTDFVAEPSPQSQLKPLR